MKDITKIEGLVDLCVYCSYTCIPERCKNFMNPKNCEFKEIRKKAYSFMTNKNR